MKIIINSHAQSRAVPININGKGRTLVVGKEETIPDDWEPALRDAGLDFTVIKDSETKGDTTDPDDTGAQPASDDQVNPSLLDGNVASVIAGLAGKTPDELTALLAAEQAGKTRTTVVTAIEKALAEHVSA